MKSAKIFFGLAAVAFLGVIGCIVAFLFAPEPVPVVEEKPQEETVVEESSENNEKTEEMLSEEATAEVARFLEKYDMVIPYEDMLEQVKIRYEYEKEYGTTYAMEEIFIVEVPKDHTVGDAGDDILESIQRYVELYNIDESRYASMTAQEELDALEVEYGPLPDETLPEEMSVEEGQDTLPPEEDSVSEVTSNEELESNSEPEVAE